MPLKVGTVGGTLESIHSAAAALRLAGVESASELAELMAAVGLAQNFAALRALVTKGIQAGHMQLHARSVVARAGVGGTSSMTSRRANSSTAARSRTGRRGDLDDLQSRRARRTADGGRQGHPARRARRRLRQTRARRADRSRRDVAAGSSELPHGDDSCWANSRNRRDGRTQFSTDRGETRRRIGLRIDDASIAPWRWGSGSSAASRSRWRGRSIGELGLGLDDERINAIAFESEQLAHGTPSGVDNTIATYAQPMLFRNGTMTFEALRPSDESRRS